MLRFSAFAEGLNGEVYQHTPFLDHKRLMPFSNCLMIKNGILSKSYI